MRLSGIGCVVIVVPKDREQKPQLTGDRALAGELADHQLLDAFRGVLDDALVGFHRVGGLLVSIQQCRTRMGMSCSTSVVISLTAASMSLRRW